MAHLITFATGKFDISQETPNEINPIAGEAVLNWIREGLAGTAYTATLPATEDWGWYMDVQGTGASYLVGASGEQDRPAPDVDWTIQIHKHRSLVDKLLGRIKLAADDALTLLIEKRARSTPEFREVVVEKLDSRARQE